MVRFGLSLALTSLLLVGADSGGNPPLLGTWSGAFRYGNETKAVSFEFRPGPPPRMVVDVPDLNFYQLGPFPLKETAGGATADDFSFRVAADGKAITGQWSFDGHEIPFELARGPLPPRPPRKDVEIPVARPAWTFRTGGAIWSSPVVDERRVYFGSSDGILYALDVASGKLAWRFETGRPIFSPVSVSGDHIYLVSDNGYLYKLARNSGAVIWRFDTHGGAVKRILPEPSTNSTYDILGSGATEEGAFVYVGSADGNLYAVDTASGAERWRFPTGGIVRSTPAVSGGRVFFGSRDHRVYALDATTGVPLWSHDTLREVVSSPLVVGGAVYIGSRSSDFLALEAATGKVLWSYFYWSSWVESSARIRDETLYVGSSDYQKVFALRAKDGNPVWEFGTAGSPWGTPFVTDKEVFIGAVGVLHYFIDHKGAFFALERSSGRPLWRYPFPPIPGAMLYGVASSPQVLNQIVLFGGLDGTFYAFPVAAG